MNKLKVGGIVLGLFVGIFILGIVMNFMGIVSKTTEPANVIGRYEEFFDRCAAIERHETSLATQKLLLEDAESSDERTRIRANVAGLTAQRQGAISQYNADASKLNVGIFQSNNLPQKLDADGVTNCGG